MAIWLIRAGRNGEREDFALETSVAVIGWNEVPDLTKVASREELKAVIQKAYPQSPKGRISNFAGQLWAFRNTVDKGSFVILPLKTRGTIAIGKVTGDYEYAPQNPENAKHVRKVDWLRDDVPRSAFSQKLLYSFGAFMTVCKIDREGAEAEIIAALKGKPKPTPTSTLATPEAGEEESLDDQTALIDLEDQAKTLIHAHITAHFAGHHLADIVQAILDAQGFECLTSEPGPDGGVDILAGHGKMGLEAPRLCVQVKSSDSPADVKVLRELRRAGLSAHMELEARSIKAQMKRADRVAARAAVIVGGDELARGELTLRDMRASEQTAIPRANVVQAVSAVLK